ncbi:MAG TPA: ABC transporter ATP-binding protein [Flavipsychrobacter sp.]|nr:ABC transporter ATP-binding protein [Flavipsychrobacter sp.]
MERKSNNVFSALRKLYSIFNQSQKRKFGWLVFFTFLSSISDLVGLGFVIPVVGLVLSESFHERFVAFAPFLSSFNKEHLLLITVGLFFLLIVVKNLFGLYINKLQVNFVRHLYVTSTESVLNKVYEKPLPEILEASSNKWVNKVTELQVMLCSNMAISIMIIINEAMIFALTTIIVCAWNWHLFLLLIVVLIPSIGFFYSRVKHIIKDAGAEKNKNYVNLHHKAQEMIFGYTDIKIAGTEKNFKKTFVDTARRFSIVQGKVDFILFIPTRIIEVAIFLCITIILLYGVYVIKDINNIVTTITLFSVIAYRSIPSVNRFVIAMNNVTAAEFVLNDKDFFPDHSINTSDEEIAPLPFKNQIHFDHISYQYPGNAKNVLNNCNLVIKKGEKIGIVGKSGTGKSTLVNNILGFLQPTSGKIYVDDAELNRSNFKNWWKILGYVRQDAFILNTTLAENIALGETLEQLDTQRVHHAIKMASLTSLVEEMPEGINTLLSERGNNLSGGQKQRIAIARAIYKGAQVLIFDEATSALDSKTEEEITDAINELGKEDLTIIIIAHRYTSLRFCEKIYKIDDGMISDTYSYQELVKSVN